MNKPIMITGLFKYGMPVLTFKDPVDLEDIYRTCFIDWFDESINQIRLEDGSILPVDPWGLHQLYAEGRIMPHQYIQMAKNSEVAV